MRLYYKRILLDINHEINRLYTILNNIELRLSELNIDKERSLFEYLFRGNKFEIQLYLDNINYLINQSNQYKNIILRDIDFKIRERENISLINYYI